MGRGVRLGALEQAGFGSVADVACVRSNQLYAVSGVGERTVLEVQRAARAVALGVYREIRFRVRPAPLDPAQTQLLATLGATRTANVAVAAQREALQAFIAHAVPLVADAERTTLMPSQISVEPLHQVLAWTARRRDVSWG